MEDAQDPVEDSGRPDAIDAARVDKEAAKPIPSTESAPPLATWLLIYTALRIGMLVVLTLLLSLVMPLILALLFAVIAALPLSWLLFGGVRRRVNAAVAVRTAGRRTERQRLRAQLDGTELR